jgi:hypothetical protein
MRLFEIFLEKEKGSLYIKRFDTVHVWVYIILITIIDCSKLREYNKCTT